jgi:hypothetical protein
MDRLCPMCSRLGLDDHGRRIVVVSTPSTGLEVGRTFFVLGDAISCATASDPARWCFTGERTGQVAPVLVTRRTSRELTASP